MPRVPVEEYPSVPAEAASTPYSNVQANPSAFGALAGAAEQRTGAELQQGAGDLVQAAIIRQNRFNQIASTDAFSKLQQGYLNLTYGDPNDPNQKGFYALHGEEAMHAWPATRQALDSLRTQIRVGLQNDAQRLEFDNAARYLQGRTMESIGRHYDVQFDAYQTAVQTSAERVNLRQIGAHYNDDTNFNDSLEGLRQAAVRKLQTQYGNNPDPKMITAELNRVTSDAIKTRTLAWGANDPAAALGWLKTQQSQVDPTTYLQLERELKPHVLSDVADAWLTKKLDPPGAVAPLPGGSAPSAPSGGAYRKDTAANLSSHTFNAEEEATLDRMVGQESGGKQFGTGGAPLTSPQGAVGKLQVMPATAQDVAAHHGFEYDEGRLKHDVDYNTMVGRTYFGDMLEAYGGNRTLATAAYNAGPNRVDEWLTQNGDPRTGQISDAAWAAKIPFNETRKYVLNTAQPRDTSTGSAPSSAASTASLARPATDAAPYVIGDSLGVGIRLAGGYKGTALTGVAPDAVLRMVQALPADQVSGKHIVLSGGASSNPAQVGLVEDQVNALKQKGAAGITIVGVGDRSDLAPLNANLQQIAQRTGSNFAPVDPATLATDRVHPHDYRPLARSAAAFGMQGEQPPAATPVSATTAAPAPALPPIGVAAAQQAPLAGTPGTQFPDEDQFVIDAERDFAGNKDMQDAAYNKVKRHFAVLNAETKNARTALQKTIGDTSAALLGGQDTPIPVDRIHALFPKDQADRIVSGLTIDGFAGQQFKNAQFGSQQDVAGAINDLQTGLGPVSKLLRSKAAGLPGLEPAGTEGSAENYALRQQVADKLKQQFATRQAALSTDPAAYALGSPTVAAPFKAIVDLPKNAPPEQQQQAWSSYATVQLSLQDQMGVPDQHRHILTQDQAEQETGRMMNADPGTVDVGAMLRDKAALYGDNWNRVWGDMVTLGKLPQSWQTLGVIRSQTGRREFQTMLRLADDKGGRAKLEEMVPKTELQSIRDGLADTMRPFASTAYVPGWGGDPELAGRVTNDVRDLAYFYSAMEGQPGAKALDHAYQTIIGDRYDVDGNQRMPKGRSAAVQAAEESLLQSLKAADLAPAPDVLATPPAGGQAGPAVPALTVDQRRELARNYVGNYYSHWVTNHSDTGATYVGGRSEGGPFVPVMRADGTPVQILWKDVQPPGAAQAPGLPAGTMNPGEAPVGP